MKFYRILFILFSLSFFAGEVRAQEVIPCRYPLQVSADSLVNFVRKDFEWRTGKPTQIEPEDWKMYFYDNTRGIDFTSAYNQAQQFLLEKLGREVFCRYTDLMLNSFEINPTNSNEFYLTYYLQLPNLENPKQIGYMQFNYEVVPLKFTFNLQPDNTLRTTVPTNVPECNNQPDCGITITKERALQIARAKEIITNNVDYFIETDGRDWVIRTSPNGGKTVIAHRINLQTGAVSGPLTVVK
ncbi:hypothetical protein [Adhaeribacter terreus]|uniref:PepSY domain-containing protein n=1 Tax=Adhaeribacter terreus TaxID=529703 RepID=A0ABW0EBJ3_9BACT